MIIHTQKNWAVFFFLVLAPGGLVVSVASVVSTVLAPGGSSWLLVAPGGFCGFCGFCGFYGFLWLLAPMVHLSSIIYRSIYQWSMFTRCMLCIRYTCIFLYLYLNLYLSIFLSVYLSIDLSIYLSICLSLSIPIYIYLCLCLYLCLFYIYVYIYLYLYKSNYIYLCLSMSIFCTYMSYP